MKCKQCGKRNTLPVGKNLHRRCTVLWNAEHIPKGQKKKLSICPHCGCRFYFWQKASAHAQENKHYGDYSN